MTMALRLNLRRCGVLTLSIGPLLLKVCGSSGGTAYIDANWLPPLATPPFPSCTSGHSTQSGATSWVLADLLGEIPFVDHSHDDMSLPARSLAGFTQAAEEAAVSRLYGGIHYVFDNVDGLEAGRCIARKILDRVHFRRGGCRCR